MLGGFGDGVAVEEGEGTDALSGHGVGGMLADSWDGEQMAEGELWFF